MDKSNEPQLKSTSELGYYTDPAPTKETWAEYQSDNSTPYCYVDATYDMLQKIEKVMAIDDFAMMKEELTKLYAERYEFVSYALNHPE